MQALRVSSHKAPRAVLGRCSGRCCAQASPTFEFGLKDPPKPTPLTKGPLVSWEKLIPPTIVGKLGPCGDSGLKPEFGLLGEPFPKRGKWDDFVESRTRNIPKKFKSHFDAQKQLGWLLQAPGEDKQPDESGVSLVDHINFFDFVSTVLDRLDQRIWYLIFKVCDEPGSINAVGMLSLVVDCGPAEFFIPTYAQLVRGFPNATRINHPARGSTVSRNGGKLLADHKRMLELAAAAAGVTIQEGEEQIARVSEIQNPDPALEEFVRDLVAVAEDGILGPNREDVLVELRLVLDEWLDYIWPFGSSTNQKSTLYRLNESQWTLDLEPWLVRDPDNDSYNLEHATELLESAAKVANVGGLAKWRLMNLYNFELPHAKRLVRGAEEALLQGAYIKNCNRAL